MSAKQSGSESEPRSKSVLAGRSGPVRTALLESLGVARDAGRMDPIHELQAQLAERYAALVDRATSSGDEGALIRAAEKLTVVLERLPVRTPVSEGGGTGDSPDDRDRLILVMDSGPQVGDSAHA